MSINCDNLIELWATLCANLTCFRYNKVWTFLTTLWIYNVFSLFTLCITCILWLSRLLYYWTITHISSTLLKIFTYFLYCIHCDICTTLYTFSCFSWNIVILITINITWWFTLFSSFSSFLFYSHCWTTIRYTCIYTLWIWLFYMEISTRTFWSTLNTIQELIILASCLCWTYIIFTSILTSITIWWTLINFNIHTFFMTASCKTNSFLTYLCLVNTIFWLIFTNEIWIYLISVLSFLTSLT